MAKIKVKLREEKKGQFQPAVEKKYNDKLNNQSKWQK